MFRPLKQYLTTATGLSRIDSKAQRDFWSFLKILSVWGDIVGPMVYEHTRPKRIDGKTLVVTVNHPAFSHELKNMQEKILSEIFIRIPYWEKKLSALKFVVGQLEKDVESSDQDYSLGTLPPSMDKQKFLNLKNQQRQIYQAETDLDDEFKDLLSSLHAQVLLDKEQK